MKKIEPLTASERLYAEKHHDLVYHFLSHYKLKEDEYYDIIIFGYLAAIQEYLRDPELQCYQFSTIAWKKMYWAYLQNLIYTNRPKRKALTVTYQEDSPIEELNRFLPNRIDALADQMHDREITLELLSYLTPKEKEVVFLKANGYTHAEIAKKCRITVAGVQSRLSRFRSRLTTTSYVPHRGDAA